MQTFTTKTGFGYFKDANGYIVAKFILPIGDHPINAGYTAVDVADEASLGSVSINVPPTTAQQIASLKAQLNDIDLKSIRSIRAGETTYIQQYETQAQSLRQQLKALGG